MGALDTILIPSLRLEEIASDGSDLTNPAADSRRLFLGEDGYLHLIDSSGNVTDPIAPSGGAVATDSIWDAAGDLAVGTGANTAAKLSLGATGTVPRSNGSTLVSAHVPGTLLAYKREASAHTYTISSATLTDVDASNMAVTFTVPTTGNVIVRLIGFCDTSAGTAGQFYVWGLRESTSDIGVATTILRAPDANGSMRSCDILVTGLTPGDSKTYKWSFAISQASAATGRILVGAGGASTAPPAFMEVFVAP